MSDVAAGFDGYEPSEDDRDWMLEEAERFDALSPEGQSYELGHAEAQWEMHLEALDEDRCWQLELEARRAAAALRWRQTRLAGIVRPVTRVCSRGRARRGRRASTRARSRSPGREPPQADPPLRRHEAAA